MRSEPHECGHLLQRLLVALAALGVDVVGLSSRPPMLWFYKFAAVVAAVPPPPARLAPELIHFCFSQPMYTTNVMLTNKDTTNVMLTQVNITTN